ncbi:MAG TPA: hypothetical protein PKC28_16735 [Bdellovibrionales bacterium]|nr:hypothetical protein [Bdellovibrionales bacterium]
MPSLHERAFRRALTKLSVELKRLQSRDFKRRYRQARVHAFEIEFLAKFFDKLPGGRHWRVMRDLSKELEDHLGRFDELDAVGRAKARDVARMREWLVEEAWTPLRDPDSKLHEIKGRLDRIEWLRDKDLRVYAIKRLSQQLEKLQLEIKAGQYDPKSERGYTFAENETKVHELRRNIRKISMYMNYLGGVFKLVDRAPNRGHAELMARFAPLKKTALAKQSFAKLPPARIARPVTVPRPYFLAITRFVFELGEAKDRAVNGHALGRKLDFNRKNLKNLCGARLSYNTLVLGVLAELRDTRLFTRMAEVVKQQG